MAYFILTMFALLYVRVGIIAFFILTMFALSYVTVGIITFFILTMFALLYVRVDILLIYGMHLHDVISLLRREVRTYNTYLNLPLVIEVSVPSLESIYVLGIDIDSASTIFLLKFELFLLKG